MLMTRDVPLLLNHQRNREHSKPTSGTVSPRSEPSPTPFQKFAFRVLRDTSTEPPESRQLSSTDDDGVGSDSGSEYVEWDRNLYERKRLSCSRRGRNKQYPPPTAKSNHKSTDDSRSHSDRHSESKSDDLYDSEVNSLNSCWRRADLCVTQFLKAQDAATECNRHNYNMKLQETDLKEKVSKRNFFHKAKGRNRGEGEVGASSSKTTLETRAKFDRRDSKIALYKGEVTNEAATVELLPSPSDQDTWQKCRDHHGALEKAAGSNDTRYGSKHNSETRQRTEHWVKECNQLDAYKETIQCWDMDSLALSNTTSSGSESSAESMPQPCRAECGNHVDYDALIQQQLKCMANEAKLDMKCDFPSFTSGHSRKSKHTNSSKSQSSQKLDKEQYIPRNLTGNGKRSGANSFGSEGDKAEDDRASVEGSSGQAKILSGYFRENAEKTEKFKTSKCKNYQDRANSPIKIKMVHSNKSAGNDEEKSRNHVEESAVYARQGPCSLATKESAVQTTDGLTIDDPSISPNLTETIGVQCPSDAEIDIKQLLPRNSLGLNIYNADEALLEVPSDFQGEPIIFDANADMLNITLADDEEQIKAKLMAAALTTKLSSNLVKHLKVAPATAKRQSLGDYKPSEVFRRRAALDESELICSECDTTDWDEGHSSHDQDEYVARLAERTLRVCCKIYNEDLQLPKGSQTRQVDWPAFELDKQSFPDMAKAFNKRFMVQLNQVQSCFHEGQQAIGK